jgi:hypothetical protein
MPPAGFEPAIPAVKWPQTYALDRKATGIGGLQLRKIKIQAKFFNTIKNITTYFPF